MRAAALLLLLAAVTAAEDWRYPRGNLANTGVVKNRGPTREPQVVWEHEEKDVIGTGAALSLGRLVYGVGEFVVACRTKGSGGEVWDAAVKQQVSAWPSIVGDLIYVGSPDQVHYILRMSDGKENGAPEAQGGIVADPAVTDDCYLAGSLDGYFYAMANKGTRVFWRRETGPIRHGAAVMKGKIYVANENGTLYAFDVKGRELWRYEAKAKPLAAPILAKTTVLLPLPDRVQSVALKRGKEGESYETKGLSAAPALDKTRLCYGTDQGEVVVFDLKARKELARAKVAQSAISSPLILAQKILYGAAGETLFAVDLKGKLLWTYQGEAAFRPPIVADKAIYVGAGNVFYCLR
ncbi:MAG: outer membrane protein assembly factor BamB family protein [Planctomycetota bacterium]